MANHPNTNTQISAVGRVRPAVKHALWILLPLINACGPSQTLQPWHTVKLESEYTVAKADSIKTLADYIRLEDELFNELSEKIYSDASPDSGFSIQRYTNGSLADPAQRTPNWNRTFEMPVENPQSVVLLLHGLTDSPYTFNAIASSLSNNGNHVIGLRLPGHGTAPSALTSFKWQDVSTAVRLALRHATTVAGDKPIHIIGYSFGAALAVNGAFDAYDYDDIRTPSSLILLSPAIGVSSAAAFAGTADRLSRVPGLRGLRWSRVIPEYDPYKYNSFTFNAGSQVYQLTKRIEKRLAQRASQYPADLLPPTLILKSAVDSTVSTQAIIEKFMMKLEPGKHELVSFDVNRVGVIAELLTDNPGPYTKSLMENRALPFAFSLLTNINDQSNSVEVRTKPAGADQIGNVEDLPFSWPDSTFSLSHIALPFPPDDSMYGAKAPDTSTQLFLGDSRLVGETGMLVFPSSWLMRLRHNPFYNYLESRTLEWVSANSQ